MKLLLDTCSFLWICADAPELSRRARELFVDPSNEVYLSAVSCWEIALAHSLERLRLAVAPWEFVKAERERHGIEPLALDEDSALQLTLLPKRHRDPFDRMLVCQALVHGLVVLTPDRAIAQYPVRTLW